MPPNILAAHYTVWIDPLQNPPEVVKFGIQRFDIFRLETVLLRPVWPTTMRGEESCELLMETAIRNRKTVRSGGMISIYDQPYPIKGVRTYR
jgi:hypothetical protein